MAGERLREELEAQRREQLQAVLRRVETGVSALMGEREARMEGEMRRGAELQELLRRAETERVAWQRLAREREAAAASLANALERLRSCSPSPAAGDDEDAESCCAAEKEKREEEEEEAEGRNRLPATSGASCRGCGERPARVVMLPCRHLCACGPCGSAVRTCPVCGSAKRASLEVFFM
ncbi:putative BOI-related E3 ubiquitin-protein ligase 3 [Nymphaea thermarum]|nr:putative BOI-related E3 ubiquitin-protein ligase 3 [Nymphaea thermarum]